MEVSQHTANTEHGSGSLQISSHAAPLAEHYPTLAPLLDAFPLLLKPEWAFCLVQTTKSISGDVMKNKHMRRVASRTFAEAFFF